MKGFVSSRLHPAANLALLMVLLLAALCVAGFFTMALSQIFFGIGFQELGNVNRHPQDYPQGWGVMMLAQGVTLLVMLGGAAVAFARLTGHTLADYFAPRRPVPVGWLLLAAALIILSLPAMSSLIAWNAQLHLPAFLADWEQWARESEDRAQSITSYLTRFSSQWRLLVALVVIAVVPAMSEELFFRGVIQRNLVQWFGSRHMGIWAAAAIFSAIHMQFFGFFPRFVLGLVLGYLYEWSGSILVPMAAHFTQNAFQLLLLYAQQRDWSSAEFDPDSTEALPWYLVLASFVLCGLLLRYIYRHTQTPRPDELPTEMHTLGGRGVAVHRPEEVHPAARTLSHDGIDATRS